MSDPVAEQMTALLRYANYAKVARDLGVSRQTVMRWARGEAVTPWQLQRLRGLFGVVQTEIEGPPPWAEGLAANVADSVVDRITTRLALPLEPAQIADLVTRLEQSLRPAVEPSPEESKASRDNGDTSPRQPQSRSSRT